MEVIMRLTSYFLFPFDVEVIVVEPTTKSGSESDAEVVWNRGADTDMGKAIWVNPYLVIV